jgi:GH25 family lysozyme M1 (1,4-beta-N-acetylmuramidase)
MSMALRHWRTGGVVTALCGLVVASLAVPAIATSTVADGGDWANAGAAPGSQASQVTTNPKTSSAMQPSVTIGSQTYSVTGIDVSSHDHSTYPIDWASVAASGVDFAYVKVTEETTLGTYVNPYFNSDFQCGKG